MCYNVVDGYMVYPKNFVESANMAEKINCCCIIGHRKINETEELKKKVYENVERLIREEGVEIFLFGSGSRFDSMCLEIVTEIKEKYPQIKRVYVRAEFPYINDSYRAYLLKIYDNMYFPEKIKGGGRAAYVERNRDMIDNSRYCLIYYNEKYNPKTRKSGTKLAYDYAVKRQKEIINLFLEEG